MKTILKYAPIVAALLLITSCASKKVITDGTQTSTLTTTKTDKNAEKAAAKRSQQFVQRIANNSVEAENIVTSGDFTLQIGSKEITVPTKLSMRKNECIRIQLLMPILRSELARIEFTPDYVLLLDRYHKEYIQASYSEVNFLANNGLSFYSLQALFWNQLTAPGTKNITESDLKKFEADVNESSSRVPVTLKGGNITYKWSVDAATALINGAEITYTSPTHGTSSLTWTYNDFKTVGQNKFPATQQFGFSTNYGGSNRAAQVTLQMAAPKTTTNWDTKTEVSSKYRKVDVDQLLRKITSLQ